MGGLHATPGLVRVGFDDSVPSFLGNKLKAGDGIEIESDYDHEHGGKSLLISSPIGNILTLSVSSQIPRNVSTVFIDASKNPINIIFPEAKNAIRTLTLVCIDNSNSITLSVPDKTILFSSDNIQFQSAGDSFIFTSNRKDTWFAISRYTNCWY